MGQGFVAWLSEPARTGWPWPVCVEMNRLCWAVVFLAGAKTKMEFFRSGRRPEQLGRFPFERALIWEMESREFATDTADKTCDFRPAKHYTFGRSKAGGFERIIRKSGVRNRKRLWKCAANRKLFTSTIFRHLAPHMTHGPVQGSGKRSGVRSRRVEGKRRAAEKWAGPFFGPLSNCPRSRKVGQRVRAGMKASILYPQSHFNLKRPFSILKVSN